MKKIGISLQLYSMRYLVVALLFVIAIWAGLFYAVILEEVYDNIDDGLKNSKMLIIRESYAHPEILQTREFGINQYKIQPLPKGSYDFSDKFINTFEFMEYDDDDEPVRLLQTVFNDSQGNPYRLTIRASMVEEDELMEDLLTALVALYVMLVVSIALLYRLVHKKTWHPFYNLLQKLKGYKPGSGTTVELPVTNILEFRTLTAEIKELLQRNEATYASQKQFIENASHELQTPLAISLNKLDLFTEKTNLDEEQLTELGKISETLQRLVRLNKSLLMLSKIENRQYQETEVVNFNALTEQLLEDFADLAEYKNVSLHTKFENDLSFSMNKGLAMVLVSNLIKNALVHNHAAGTVTVYITGNALTVENTGIQHPLDADRVFKRFYRDVAHEQGTGLGLSIVQSVADMYGVKPEYSFNGHHRFTLVFPEST